MPRASRIAPAVIGVAAALLFAVAIAVEIGLVWPSVAKARAAILSASAAEREPPFTVQQVLARAHGEALVHQVARQLLALEPAQLEGATAIERQLAGLALAHALPMHLSAAELSTFFLSQAHMGPGVRGFSQAAQTFLATDLSTVSLPQAARLMAISHAPSAYLASPQRLASREARLLGTGAQ
jgi:membrane carboxypeptidase/penicillin-binding protein